jgi:chitinase
LSKRFPGRRLSILRLGVLAAVVALAVTAGYLGLRNVYDAQAAASIPSVFSGYVDVTAAPRFGFEAPAGPEVKAVVLSFVVADPKDNCAPSWGAAYSPSQAGTELDLDRRIARLRQIGGSAAVSFGGLNNTELALSCTDQESLTRAYRQIVDRYDTATIDLDIEGGALTDTAAADRRGKAVAALQQERQALGKPLAVWLTLPADPAGLTEQGRDIVARTLAGGVDLAGVNIMTMNYGASKPAGWSMSRASAAAAEAAHGQLTSLYGQAGVDLGSGTVWRKLGLTPMIGQNDVAGDIFTLEDATSMNSFARAKGIGRVSMWSLNRDRTCSSNYPELTRVSDSCSGVGQGSVRFSTALGADVVPSGPAEAPSEEATATPAASDDPATSPYPVWNPDAAYSGGGRIVWHGNVYEAKWWTRADFPDDPVLQGEATPWKLVGPVLPGDRPSPPATVPAGTFPDWTPETVYRKGDRTLFDGSAFEAKWWTQGDSPEAAAQGAAGSPWVRLDAAAIQTASPTASAR